MNKLLHFIFDISLICVLMTIIKVVQMILLLLLYPLISESSRTTSASNIDVFLLIPELDSELISANRKTILLSCQFSLDHLDAVYDFKVLPLVWKSKGD